jgi:hypothetical protein
VKNLQADKLLTVRNEMEIEEWYGFPSLPSSMTSSMSKLYFMGNKAIIMECYDCGKYTHYVGLDVAVIYKTSL